MKYGVTSERKSRETETHYVADETGALKAMDVAGCCEKSKDRVLLQKRKPGALWHIYEAQDSDKIRDLLKKVVIVCLHHFLSSQVELVT